MSLMHLVPTAGAAFLASLVECVEAAQLLPFEAGRAFEAAAFEDLLASPELVMVAADDDEPTRFLDGLLASLAQVSPALQN